MGLGAERQVAKLVVYLKLSLIRWCVLTASKQGIHVEAACVVAGQVLYGQLGSHMHRLAVAKLARYALTIHQTVGPFTD